MQQDKLQFPLEVPIISLKANDGVHVLDEMSAASTAKASIQFDMAVVGKPSPAGKPASFLLMWHVWLHLRWYLKVTWICTLQCAASRWHNTFCPLIMQHEAIYAYVKIILHFGVMTGLHVKQPDMQS